MVGKEGAPQAGDSADPETKEAPRGDETPEAPSPKGEPTMDITKSTSLNDLQVIAEAVAAHAPELLSRTEKALGILLHGKCARVDGDVFEVLASTTAAATGSISAPARVTARIGSTGASSTAASSTASTCSPPGSSRSSRPAPAPAPAPPAWPRFAAIRPGGR